MNQEINNQENHHTHSKHWVGFGFVFLTSIIFASSIMYYLMDQENKNEKRALATQIESENKIRQDCEIEKEVLKREVAALKKEIAEDENQNTEYREKNCSTKNLGWGKYVIPNRDTYSTDDWTSYVSTKSMTTISVEYPSDWRLDGNIIYDKENKKIAQLPSIIELKQNQKCFDSEMQESNMQKLVSQESIQIGEQQGVLRVLKTIKDPGGGNWYPNRYCMTSKDKTFTVTFYEMELGSGDKSLFEKIISTVEIK